MTGEEQDPLQLLVVKEEVEGPQRTLLSIGVRVQIRVITTWKHIDDYNREFNYHRATITN